MCISNFLITMNAVTKSIELEEIRVIESTLKNKILQDSMITSSEASEK